MTRDTAIDHPIRIGFLIFPNLTVLDFIGPYQVLTRVPGAQVHLVARSREAVRDHDVLSLLPTDDFSSAPAFDVFCVPGGPGEGAAIDDAATRDYVRRVGGQAQWLTSVCTGSLILGAAGLLQGRRATSHWSALDVLPIYGATPVRARIVEDGALITGGGVTAGIDFGLHLAARLAGAEVAQAIQLSLEYAPQPPFDAGRPETAPPAIHERVRGLAEARTAERLAQAQAVVRAWT